MDLSTAQNTTSISNRKRNYPDSTLSIISSKRARSYGSYFQQTFSLPSSIIYYITKNPSSAKVYQKLIQSCKYFFIKNPILVVSSLIVEYINNQCEIRFNGNFNKLVNLSNYSYKIWIADELKIDTFDYERGEEHSITPWISKIYRNDAKKCTFLWNQNISFKDFIFLTSKCENFLWNENIVKYDDGSIVPLEKIVEVLSNVKELIFVHDIEISTIFTSKTVQELIKIPHFLTLNKFELSGIPENFDIEEFYDYIKRNTKTEIFLDFYRPISDAYKARLVAILDEIVHTEVRAFKIPWFDFLGIEDSPSYNLLCNIYGQKCYAFL